MYIRLGEWYVEWSTVSDAPKSPPMSRNTAITRMTVAEMKDRWESLESECYPLVASATDFIMLTVGKRVERLDATGSTSLDGDDPDSATRCNRAGEGGEHLSFDELVAGIAERAEKIGAARDEPWEDL